MSEAPYLPELLAARVEAARDRPKRQRTRLALLAATAEEMAQVGYENLTIEGVVRRAGLARGTFYLYFRNRADAAIAVRRAFSAVVRKLRPRGVGKLDAWDAIWSVNRFFVAFYARNAPIVAGQEALLRERPDLLKSRDQINQRWAQFLLRDLRRRSPGAMPPEGDRHALLALRYVIMMADEALRQSFTDPPDGLRKLVASEEDVTDVLSQLWYRCLYAKDPPPTLAGNDQGGGGRL